MHNFDENFQRVAAGLPEMQDEQAVKRQQQRLAEIFNELFRQLLAVFGAGQQNTRGDERDAPAVASGVQGKRDCLHGANQRRNARVARKQDCPFMPSPGQLSPGANRNQLYLPTAGCGGADRYGLPVLPDRGQYPDAESYPY